MRRYRTRDVSDDSLTDANEPTWQNFGNIFKPSLSPRCFKSSLKLSKHVSDNEGKSVLVHEFAIRMSKSTSNFLTKERRWFWGNRVNQLLWFSPNNSMSVCYTESRSFKNISCLKHKKDSTSALQERRLHLNETLFWKFSPKVSNLNFPCKWRRGFAAELQLVLSSSSGNSSLAQRHSVRGLEEFF